jgi:hypothetical protein
VVCQHWLAVAFEELVGKIQKEFKRTSCPTPDHERTPASFREIGQVQFVLRGRLFRLERRFVLKLINIHGMEFPSRKAYLPRRSWRLWQKILLVETAVKRKLSQPLYYDSFFDIL